ncbi:uncharacterized protein LOC107655821 [Tachysurus ichikawai]
MKMNMDTGRWISLIRMSQTMCQTSFPGPYIQAWTYIKEEETSNQTPADGSSASEEEDFFASMKPTRGQEGIKQLDGYQCLQS